MFLTHFGKSTGVISRNSSTVEEEQGQGLRVLGFCPSSSPPLLCDLGESLSLPGLSFPCHRLLDTGVTKTPKLWFTGGPHPSP